jgi:hypothetical protein
MWKGLSLLVANEVGSTLKRNVNGLIFYAIGGVLIVVSLVFALGATHGWLLFYMTSIEANLAIAGTLLVVALILLAIGSYVKNHRTQPSLMASTALVTAPLAARMFNGKVSPATMGVLGIIAAGALLGRQIGKR